MDIQSSPTVYPFFTNKWSLPEANNLGLFFYRSDLSRGKTQPALRGYERVSPSLHVMWIKMSSANQHPKNVDALG